MAFVIVELATIIWVGRRVARFSGDSAASLASNEVTILSRVAPRFAVAIVRRAIWALPLFRSHPVRGTDERT